MSAKSQISDNTGAVRMIRPVAVSVVFGAIVSVVILLLLSLIVSSRTVPQSMIDPMAIFAMCAGALVSGLVCAKVIHRNGLMCGLVCGLVFSVLILACSFAVPDNGLGLGSLIKIMFMVISAMIGGVLGVNTKKRRKK